MEFTPEKIDMMKGVIREVNNSIVSVSLFSGDNELSVDLDRKVFEDGKVRILADESFEFHVERSTDGVEQPVVSPLVSRKELSAQEKKQIDEDIEKLINGDTLK